MHLTALQNIEISNTEEYGRLRAELAALRRKGVTKVATGASQGGGTWAPDPARSCGRCKAELGRIINRGAVCRGCNVRVCKNCREYDVVSGHEWLCPVCNKNKEIAAASGEWVNEFIPNNGKKKTSSKLYVPSTAELLKRNIKRSWTISNPSGTGGPQLTPRNGPPHPPDLAQAHHFPPKQDLPVIDESRIASNRPVIIAQIPPPPHRGGGRPPGPPGPPPPAAHPPGPPVKRGVGRSQSMGVADTGRFYMKPGHAGAMPVSGPPPRFRPPPPPGEHGERRPVISRRVPAEYLDTSSDGETEPAMFDPIVPEYRSLDRRHYGGNPHSKQTQHKYKTLEPRSRSGGEAHSLERLNAARRVLPDVPSHSLPRQGKRAQSDSRSRDRTETDTNKRSQSHGDNVDSSGRRKLPQVPGRDLREPTPDYDSSPPPRLRRNSDSGLLDVIEEGGGGVKRHASNVLDKSSKRLNSSLDPSTESEDSKGRIKKQHQASHSSSPTAKKSQKTREINSAQAPGHNLHKRVVQSNSNGSSKGSSVTKITAAGESAEIPTAQGKTKNVSASSQLNRTLEQAGNRDGAKSSNSLNFSDLESTRIDFEETGTIIAHPILESDNNSDIVIDEKKIVPESSKFKIVFISSESKSGSELNSSMEYPEQGSPDNPDDALNNVKGDFIDEVDWENYRKNKKANKCSILTKHASQQDANSPIIAKHQNKAASRTDSPREDFAYVKNFLRDPKNRQSTSPSIRTIMTTATKDSNSIPPSPRMPKIHNIHIRRETEPHSSPSSSQPTRPRSAMSNATICSETSVDFEVQNILGNKPRANKNHPHNESQEIIIDFDSSANSSLAASSSAVKRSQTFNNRKNLDLQSVNKGYADKNAITRSHSIARSSAERSLDEMSLYDQMCIQKGGKVGKKDPRVEEYRNMVLAEIKSMSGPETTMSRSLSESDLSDLGAHSPQSRLSPSTTVTAEPETSDGDTMDRSQRSAKRKERAKVRSRSSPSCDSTPSSGYSELTSSSGSTNNKSQGLTPPPVLPPKTRKLLGVHPGGGTVQSSGVQSSATGSMATAAGELNNTTKRQQLNQSLSESEDTFEGVSVVRIGGATAIHRSQSTVGTNLRSRVSKPVRRSKSHLQGGGKYVTSITHGGSVTLVSLNNQDNDVSRQFKPIDPDISNRLSQGSAFQGSNTLPRAGTKKKTLAAGEGGSSVDDSEIVITKKLTGAGSSVRIRIGGSARSPTQNIESASHNWVEPGEQSQQRRAYTGSGSGKISPKSQDSKQRYGDSRKGGKYTLGQIEVEDFRDSDERSEVSEPEADVDNVGSDFDLNSLIEGDVDDDDFTAARDDEDARTPVVSYYEPLKDPEASVDDDVLSEGEYSEEELGSLAVNLGSLHQPGGSDTEGDFLDKCEIKNKNKSRPDKEEQSVNNSAPDNHRDNKVVASDVLGQVRTKCVTDRSVVDGGRKNILCSPDIRLETSGDITETSDFDSISTTSASYVVTNSDTESLCLDDNQLDILMNKSDLSDLDQLEDCKTITGSCSDMSDGESGVMEAGSGQHDATDHVSMSSEGQDSGQVSALVSGPACQHGQHGLPQVDRTQRGSSVARELSKGQHVTPHTSQHVNNNNISANNSHTSENPVSRDSSLPVHQQLISKHSNNDLVERSPKLEGKQSSSSGTQFSFTAIDSDRIFQDKNKLTKRKGSVSDLIAKFESSSRSATPERSLTPDSHRSLRSATPDRALSSASKHSDQSTSAVQSEPEKRVKETGARPKVPSNKNKTAVSNTNEANESLISNESEPAELRGLKEFTQKYLKEQQELAKNANSTKDDDELGGECLDKLDSEVEDILDNPDMPPTIRRNSGSGGAYTSYVFISSDPSNDDVASVVSSNGSYTDHADNRVTVNVKETGVVSPNTCVVSIQDGRTSNISIVSTESSELNSPRQSPTAGMDDSLPPELPTKVKVGHGKSHSELQQIVFATRESLRDYSHRSRGGEADLDLVDDDQASDRSGLANYFTSTLESSFISRRGRPPVIRAAEKVRRQQGGNFEYEDESRGMMIDYSDHQPYREGSSTPVLDDDMLDEYGQPRRGFKITEVGVDDYSPVHSDHYDDFDPQEHYDIQYGSGESADEYGEREDYPMCQQVYDSEEYSYSEGEQISSGDEFDREEELRGYNRAIDFTLHTIIEESCEDSEPENRSLRTTNKKRHSDPSELEKYFFYGVGGGNDGGAGSVNEESEYSDHSDDNSLHNEEHISAMRETSVDGAELTSSRLEKYFMSGFDGGEEGKQQSLDAISEAGHDTDDSGSVGSESDGARDQSGTGPGQRRKKTSGRPRGFRSMSDRGESGAENNSNVEHEPGHEASYSSESGEDNTAFVQGDGSYDTIKKKKNKARKQSDDRRSDSVDLRRSSADNADIAPATQHSKKDDKSSARQEPGSTTDPSISKHSPSGSQEESESQKPRGSQSKESPSTSPPPVGGPVRKHKSRDSGFVGSNDDLLRNESSQIVMSSSDDMQGGRNQTESSSEGEHDQLGKSKVKTRLEKVSEVSENTEDDCDKSAEAKTHVSRGHSSDNMARRDNDTSRDGSDKLSRKDSFHQWSSDEETNIMMNRMRSFFRNMLSSGAKPGRAAVDKKPAQIVHFEQQLTRLMKTVPGINDDQVKEIVEYLSSEDTWSDSYDSSDYTDYTSSDLEGHLVPDMDVDIAANIHQDIMQKMEGKKSPHSINSADLIPGESEEFQKETAIMYQKLMTSIAKMQQSQQEEAAVKANEAKKSPPIATKILHQISSRLVTLMHEVSASDNSSLSSLSDSRQNLFLSSKDFRPNQSSSPKTKPGTRHRHHRLLEGSSSIDSAKSDRFSDNSIDEADSGAGSERQRLRAAKLASLKSSSGSSNVDNDNENSYTFNSLDSPKVLMGPNLGTSPKTNPFKFTKNTSKSVEVLDLGRRRASLDDKSLKQSTTGSEYDVWQGVYRDVDQRRGSLPRGQLEQGTTSGSTSGVPDHLDDERFSWKGSFESALAADPRTRLSIEAKRRSIGSDMGSEIFSSVEQMDRSGSKSSLAQSRSPSQSSKRSLKSSLPNSRTSLQLSRSEKDVTESGKHDSDSDEQGSVSSSVRSSVSSRYGQRRSSVPEAQVLARLSEDSPSPSPLPVVQSNHPLSARQHSTNSLPRLGTSAIQKNKTSSTTLLNTSSGSSGPSQPSNIATSTQGGVRSARYRPHGYKPPPTRKMSPASSSGGPVRKSSADSLQSRFNDESEFSSKSGTPSPMVSRVTMLTGAQTRSASDLLRDYRETSVASSRGSSDITEPDNDNTGVIPSPSSSVSLVKTGSLSSLGTRSESMASVYSQGEGRYGTVLVKGELEFGFIYNMVSGSLDINIKQCRDLAAVDNKRNRSDPYVKVYLLPDRSKAGKRKTKVKKHTLNPVFEEILKFVMPRNEVERRTMWISVWHSDMFGRNDFLGEVMMPMSGQVFDDPSAKWFSLQDRTEPPEDECVVNSKGDLILALKYVPSEGSLKFSKKRKGTLMVKITEAKNLPIPRGTALPDPYCKCYLLPNHQKGKQKTGICRKTTSPRWDQTITWDDLSIEDLADRSLEVAVWDHDRMGQQDFLGGVRLNLGSGKHSGRSTAWMDAVGKEVTLWQQMLDRPNFWVEASITLRQILETNNRH